MPDYIFQEYIKFKLKKKCISILLTRDTPKIYTFMQKDREREKC